LQIPLPEGALCLADVDNIALPFQTRNWFIRAQHVNNTFLDIGRIVPINPPERILIY